MDIFELILNESDALTAEAVASCQISHRRGFTDADVEDARQEILTLTAERLKSRPLDPADPNTPVRIRRLFRFAAVDMRRRAAALPRREWRVIAETAAQAAVANAAGVPLAANERDDVARAVCAADGVLCRRSTRWVEERAVPAVREHVMADGSIRSLRHKSIDTDAYVEPVAARDHIDVDELDRLLAGYTPAQRERVRRELGEAFGG